VNQYYSLEAHCPTACDAVLTKSQAIETFGLTLSGRLSGVNNGRMKDSGRITVCISKYSIIQAQVVRNFS
jgi:hypothetical protein